MKWLNAFSTKVGISKTMLPSIIVEVKPNPDFNQEMIVFGSYALVYTGTSNNMNRIRIPSIALNESKKIRGYYFMSLYTRKILRSYEWTELPIDKNVIEKVKQLSLD